MGGDDAIEGQRRRNQSETFPWRIFDDFCQSWVAFAALLVFATIVAVAVGAPLISSQNPYDLTQVSVIDAHLSPGAKGADGKIKWLGTDGAGRDLLSAIFYGLRTSLWVGLVSGGTAFSIGVMVGLSAAYIGGLFQAFTMRAVDLQLSFPAILVALILLAVLGKGTEKVIIALVVSQWSYYARAVYGIALVERRKEYVIAALGLSLSHHRVVLRHILPNCLPPLVVIGAIQTAHAISLEATLSFLGLGLPQTEPSLGILIANGFEYMLSGRYWIALFPGIALLLTVVSINLVGDRLRDLLNPDVRL